MADKKTTRIHLPEVPNDPNDRQSTRVFLTAVRNILKRGTISSSEVQQQISSSQLSLRVNGIPNGSQSKLNLVGGSGMTITDDRAGNILLVASSGLPSPRDKRFILWQGTGGSDNPYFTVMGDQLVYISNSLSVSGQGPTIDQPAYVNMVCGGGAPNGSGQFWGRLAFNTSRKCVLEARVRAVQGVANMRWWIGMWSGAGNSLMLNPSPLIMGQKLAGFEYAPGAANWQCYMCDGAGEAAIDSGVAPSTAQTQTLRMELDGTTAAFYIDNVLVGSTANRYPVNAALGLILCVTQIAGIAGNGLSVEYVYGDCKMP